MQPLTLDDLLPLDEFSGRRREHFEAHCRYLDRYRRVRIGPLLTLIFENRQTLWFRIQEILRVARLADPVLLQQELDLYNRLLPGKGHLQAALLIEIKDEAQLIRELAPWQDIRGDMLRLHLGEHLYPAGLITCRPEDRCIGAAHWVQFPLDAAGRQLLADLSQPAFLEFKNAEYQHQSPPLSEDLRQSLVDDLNLSDKDGETSGEK